MSVKKKVSLMEMMRKILEYRFAHHWQDAVKAIGKLEALAQKNPDDKEKFALPILALKTECNKTPLEAKKLAKRLSRQLSRMSKNEWEADDDWTNFWMAYGYLVLSSIFGNGERMSARYLQKASAFVGEIRLNSSMETFQEFYGYFKEICVTILLYRGISVYRKRKPFEEEPDNEEYKASLESARILEAGTIIFPKLTFCKIYTSHLLNTAEAMAPKEISEELAEYLCLAVQSGHSHHVISALMGMAHLRRLSGAKTDDRLIRNLLANAKLFLPLVREQEEREWASAIINDFPLFAEKIRPLV